MVRWAGCILVLVSCFGIGMNRSEDLKKHLDELEELKRVFCLLKSEMEYTRAPFSEVFEKIGRKVMVPFSKWLQVLAIRLEEKTYGSFEEVWILTVDDELKKSRLHEEELQELRIIGKQLEYFNHIDLYIERLEYKISQLRKTYQSKRKLWRSLGIMGGIFLVILLL